LNDFIEQRVIDSEGIGNGRQGRFTPSAITSVSEMLGWNAVLLSAVAAGTDDRHIRLSLNLNNAEDRMRGSLQKAQRRRAV
jgi:hypothetical protein